VAFSMAWHAVQVEGTTGDDPACGLLAAFRGELYRCFVTYRDALFELADAVLCKQDRVHVLAELSLEPEHRRGHGALYGAVNCGRIDIARLRWSPACRFDIEHTFRFFKQTLGWTRPKLRDPAAADRWTWLIIACYVQLRLARRLAADLRLPWQRPCPPGRLTPPGSAAGSAASTRHSQTWPARRNPANPDPDARPDRRTAARPPATTILVVNSGSCGEAEFEACQVAGPAPVQWRAGPVGLQPQEVEGAGHVHVVEAGLGQAAVAGAPGAVAGGLVHGAFDAGPAGVVSLERDRCLRGARGGLGLG
jgi:hypothetical protein